MTGVFCSAPEASHSGHETPNVRARNTAVSCRATQRFMPTLPGRALAAVSRRPQQ